MHRLRIALLTAAALAFAAVPTVAAQDSASPTPLDATECSVEAISFEEISGTLATPAASPEVEDVAVEASPTAVTAPDGEPADDETAAAVTETINQLTACLNSGQLLSVLALYSDDFLQNAFSELEITEEIYNEQLTVVEPRPEGQQVVLYAFGDVVITEDGRAAVVVVGDDESSEGEPSGTLFYLVEEDGTWKVDDTVNDVPLES